MTSVNAKHEALLDELLKDYTNPHDILGEHGLLKQLTKRVVERVLEAELTAHLGYAPHVRHGTEEQNARNGKGHKTVQTDTGPVDLVVPRDRNGSFAPQLVPKRQRRLEGFDDKVLSLYARGLSTRDRRQPSIMLAWLSSSEKMASPSRTRAGITARLVLNPDCRTSVASTPLKAAKVCSSSWCRDRVPAILRTAAGPTPKRSMAAWADSRRRG